MSGEAGAETFIDGDAYTGGGSNGKELTPQFILMAHIDRCARLGSMDFRAGGYWSAQTKIVDGQTLRQYGYHSSPGFAFEQAVLTLYNLISGFGDGKDPKVLIAEYSKYEDSVKQAHSEYHTSVDTTKSQAVPEYAKMDAGSSYAATRGMAARSLFQACSAWLKRHNYLSSESIEEGLEE